MAAFTAALRETEPPQGPIRGLGVLFPGTDSAMVQP